MKPSPPIVLPPAPVRTDAERIPAARDFADRPSRRRTVPGVAANAAPRELIDHRLPAAVAAPGGVRRQPWRFVAVRAPAPKRRIRDAAERACFALDAAGRVPKRRDPHASVGIASGRPIAVREAGAATLIDAARPMGGRDALLGRPKYGRAGLLRGVGCPTAAGRLADLRRLAPDESAGSL